jgi:hypothetical protein
VHSLRQLDPPSRILPDRRPRGMGARPLRLARARITLVGEVLALEQIAEKPDRLKA